REDVAKAAIDGLGQLSAFAAKSGINVLVENHGGYSSNGQWLSGVIDKVGVKNCGTLPDFGNFITNYETKEEYDRYTGVIELMPFAKAVSAKSHNFDKQGLETKTDYLKMMNIVKEAGYTGYVGIEYEGSKLPEEEGIRLTKALLEKAGATLG
ncbi:MAG: sugar phosphate isomerase/epimerase family protein, partial [Chitinophagales bacterium]